MSLNTSSNSNPLTPKNIFQSMPGFSWRVKQYASARMAVGIKMIIEIHGTVKVTMIFFISLYNFSKLLQYFHTYNFGAIGTL